LDDAEISLGLDVVGIERQNGSEFVKSRIELLIGHSLLRSGEVLANLALGSGDCLLREETDECEREEDQKEDCHV
jgi:hypothetical protein